MSRQRTGVTTALPVAIALAVTIMMFCGCGNGTPATPTPTGTATAATATATATPTAATGAVLNAEAPGFTLPTADGGTVALDDLKGQPVMVTFWTTKCGACRSQVPFVQAAFEERGEEVSFVAVNIGESSETVQEYANAAGVGFTVALDQYGQAASAYNIRFIPDNFFIDEEGIIRYIRVGAFGSTEELLAVLDSL